MVRVHHGDGLQGTFQRLFDTRARRLMRMREGVAEPRRYGPKRPTKRAGAGARSRWCRPPGLQRALVGLTFTGVVLHADASYFQTPPPTLLAETE